MIHTVQQKPTDLVLTILATALPDTVTILKTDKITINQWSFEFSIIGESHVVTVNREERLQFHEMLACVHVPEIHCTHYYPFHTLHAHHHNTQGYSVDVAFAPLPTWTLPDTSITPHLEVAFPMVWGKMPITRIAWDYDNDQITWWTLHVYPERDTTTYVHTKSQFQLIEPDIKQGV